MKAIQLLSVLVLAGSNLTAFAQDNRQHGAHEHGTGRLDIAVDGAKIYVELNSPAANIVGFEHAPNSEKDHQTLDSALARLKDGSALFTLPRAARCSLASSDSGTPLANHADEHHGEESHGREEAHAEITATWIFDCARPEALDRVTVRLFEAFPLTERLQVQFITEQTQGSAVLSPSKPDLRF